jgi:dTMP kinase
MTGLFLVFEGVEGCGKSTQARLFADRLAAAGIPHVLTREPGGTPIGEALRQLVLHGKGHVATETELLLMLAARSAHIHEVVQPALGRAEVVVCDRFELSTFAYQGVGRGLGLERVKGLNAFATGGLKPDLTLVFDVPVAVGTARRIATRAGDDRIESAGSDFHERVAGAYRLLANQEDRMVLIDGTAPQEQVAQKVKDLLKARFPETFERISG